MANIQSKHDMLEKQFNEFEERLKKNPKDNDLLEFFTNIDNLINSDEKDIEKLEIIKKRLLKLKDLFGDIRQDIRRKTNESLQRTRDVSKYIKASKIKNY